MLKKVVRWPVQLLAIIAVAIAMVAQWFASLMLIAYYKTADVGGADYEKAASSVLSPIRWVKSKIEAK